MSAPSCLLHPGSTVRRFGRYVTGRWVRQRWQCVPGDGSTHTFSVPVPVGDDARYVDASAEWIQYASPPGYCFSVAEVVSALIDVGRGMSYREAGRLVRSRNAVLGKDPAGLGGGHGGMVADWVEVFAPVLVSCFAPEGPSDLVVFDSIGFPLDRRGGSRQGVEESGFRILGALGYSGFPELLGMSVVADESTEAWKVFLGSVSGGPFSAVDGRGEAFGEAVGELWPESVRGTGRVEVGGLLEASGALAGDLRWVVSRLRRRGGRFQNLERTDRLVGLMTLHRRGLDDPAGYGGVLVDHFVGSGTVPVPQRGVSGPGRGLLSRSGRR